MGPVWAMGFCPDIKKQETMRIVDIDGIQKVSSVE